MNNDNVIAILEEAGIKPTSNRILVLREIVDAGRPLGLSDIEERLETIEKSSIFRVLSLLLEHGVVHAVEDGRGIVKYEICKGHGECLTENLHVHFYCESCNEVICFESIPTPMVELPDGFAVNSINYMIKGICRRCKDAGAAGKCR